MLKQTKTAYNGVSTFPQKEVGWGTTKVPCPPLRKFTQVRLLESWILILNLEWSNVRMEKLLELIPDTGKDWGQKKEATQDEVVGWHHHFNGHEFEQTLGDGEGQRSLASCSPWGHKESDRTGRLNNEQSILARALMRLPKSFYWLDNLSSLGGKLFYWFHKLFNIF